MKHFWTEDELIEHFTLCADEVILLEQKRPTGQIGFAILLKFHQYEGRFPSGPKEVPESVTIHIAKQLGLSPEVFEEYQWQGSEAKQQRSLIRDLFGYNKWSRRYANSLIKWLQHHILPEQFKIEHLKDSTLKRLRELKIEPPKPVTLERILTSAIKQWEEAFFKDLVSRLSAETQRRMDLLLYNVSQGQVDQEENNVDEEQNSLRELTADAGNISLESIIKEASKLERIRQIDLPVDLLKAIPAKFLQRYRGCKIVCVNGHD